MTVANSMDRDQVPRKWDLILAPAYLKLYKSTDKSVSRLKWDSNIISLIMNTINLNKQISLCSLKCKKQLEAFIRNSKRGYSRSKLNKCICEDLLTFWTDVFIILFGLLNLCYQTVWCFDHEVAWMINLSIIFWRLPFQCIYSGCLYWGFLS